MPIDDLVPLSVADLLAAYKGRQLSPVEVMRTTLAHVEAHNAAINALFFVQADRAMGEAQASEARWKAGEPMGLLDGVPVTVKDSVAVRGWPYAHGIGANRDVAPSDYDAPPTLALQAAGAPIFAKTTMPDFGLMASGLSSLHGVARNPWGRAWNTGGSSSGAGASLAAGMGWLSVGTDIAGSVRLPASHCGLVALKPTHGRVPHLPADFMRMAGPMGRRVDDVARMLTVLARPDERDTWSATTPPPAYHEALDRDVRGLRFGLLTDIGFGPKPEAPVLAAVAAAAKVLAEAGAAVEPFASPFDYDAYAPIDLFLQVRGFVELSGLPPHGDADVSPDVRAWCEKGARHEGADLYRALGAITRMKTALIAAMQPFDYLLAPTLPMVNFPAEAAGPAPERPLGHTGFTAVFNQTGQPAGTLCLGFDERRLPIGVQVIGHRGDDLGVLQVIKTLEDNRSVTMDWPLTPRG